MVIFVFQHITTKYSCLLTPCYVDPCHHGIVCPWIVDGEDRLQISRCGQQTRGGPSGSGLGKELKAPHHKTQLVMKCYEGPLTLTDTSEWHRQWKLDIIFGSWSVISLYRVGSMKTVESKLIMYKSDLRVIQVVRWDNGGIKPANNYTSFYENGNANHHL
jgi:hypothetical protein